MGVLTVVLKQIKHLRDEDTFGKSDPYVEFELEQDNFFFDKDLGQKKSSKKKGEVNPVYNETFKWENVRSTNNLKLDVKVYDEDNRGIDDCLGKCEIDIEGLDLDGTPLRVEKAIDNKRGIGFFSRTATIFLEIKFTS